MLDSLVRVSRRVGWNADRMVADRDRLPALRRLTPRAVGTHWIQSVPVERAAEDDGGLRAAVFLGPAARDASPGYNSPPGGGVTFPTGFWAPRDRSRLCPGESAPADGGRRDERSIGSASVPAPPSDRLNPPGMPCGSTRLPLNGFTYS